MSITASIKSHLRCLARNELFTTRDVLKYGKRNAVDLALHKLVRKGEITRWANGVFSLPSADPPAPEKVALLKAISRGDDIIACYDAQSGGVLPSASGCPTTFGTTGSTSSFKFGELRIHFRHTGKRAAKSCR